MLVDGDTADQSDTTSMRVLFIVCEHADYSLMYSLKSKDEEVNILKRASKILTVTLTILRVRLTLTSHTSTSLRTMWSAFEALITDLAGRLSSRQAQDDQLFIYHPTFPPGPHQLLGKAER